MKILLMTITLSLAAMNCLAQTSKLKYPKTVKGNTVDEYFGVKVSDPYRWLENDTSAATAQWVKITIDERQKMRAELEKLTIITEIYPSEANFLLIRTPKANDLYSYLVNHKIIVRNRSNIALCNNCIRITIGSTAENQQLLRAIKQYQSFT